MYNKLEDAREISAKINACSRLGESSIALQLCMEIPKIRKKAEALHARYRQMIVSGLKFVTENEKIIGKNFIIINAKDHIKDTMIGTIISILSNSLLYEEGTIIIGMAYYKNKVKVSARNVGNKGRNTREILQNSLEDIKGEVGGHKFAAGCMLNQEDEKLFINNLKKHLEIELIKI